MCNIFDFFKESDHNLRVWSIIESQLTRRTRPKTTAAGLLPGCKKIYGFSTKLINIRFWYCLIEQSMVLNSIRIYYWLIESKNRKFFAAWQQAGCCCGKTYFVRNSSSEILRKKYRESFLNYGKTANPPRIRTL